jgi:hypothetical protein
MLEKNREKKKRKKKQNEEQKVEEKRRETEREKSPWSVAGPHSSPSKEKSVPGCDPLLGGSGFSFIT